MTSIEERGTGFAAKATAGTLAIVLLAAILGLSPAQAAPPGTPAPVRPLPLCDRATDPPRGACVRESEFVDLSASGALSAAGSVQLTATPRLPPCEIGNGFTDEWSPSPCYSAIVFNPNAGCMYLDDITGEFGSCRESIYRDGEPYRVIRTSPDLGAGLDTRLACGAFSDFNTYAFGGLPNPDPALDRRWSTVARRALTCTHSIDRTPDNLPGASWNVTSVRLDVRRNGERSATEAIASVYYILEGTLGPNAPDPNEEPPDDDNNPPDDDDNPPDGDNRVLVAGSTATGTGVARASVAPSDDSAGCTVADTQFLDLAAPPPEGVTLPHGLFGFTASGCSEAFSVEVSVEYPSAIPAGSRYYKFDEQNGWFTIPAAVSGNTVTFSITDNGPGDLDPAVGVIRDPGGIGFPPVVGIPTIPLWGVCLLAGLMIFLALTGRDRTSRHPA